jgi:Major Facilitator Superfamily
MKEQFLTTSAYLWTRILGAPFWAIYNILPFLLNNEIGLTPFQFALIVTLKPLVSIFSIYWSAAFASRPDLLVRNIIIAGILGHLPFLFCPFFDNAWYYIASFALYMMLARGVVPAWMEILKRNLPSIVREKVFAKASLCGYLGNGIVAVGLGWFLDSHHEAWRWVFVFTASLSFLSILFQLRIPMQNIELKPVSDEHQLLKPWIQSWNILRDRPDYRRFQVGFMLGGMGLVLMQPALPIFFKEMLHLNYTELTTALAIFKGVGFALSTASWTKLINRIDIYKYSGIVTLFACLFPVLLYYAQYHIFLLYAAYTAYGIMQAGSELSWNLSGLIFAKKEDSIHYSNVNILAVGVRGAIVPALGSLICFFYDPLMTLVVGGLLSLAATERMFAYGRAEALAKSV